MNKNIFDLIILPYIVYIITIFKYKVYHQKYGSIIYKNKNRIMFPMFIKKKKMSILTGTNIETSDYFYMCYKKHLYNLFYFTFNKLHRKSYRLTFYLCNLTFLIFLVYLQSSL